METAHGKACSGHFDMLWVCSLFQKLEEMIYLPMINVNLFYVHRKMALENRLRHFAKGIAQKIPCSIKNEMTTNLTSWYLLIPN